MFYKCILTKNLKFTMDFNISDTNRGKKSLMCDGYLYTIDIVPDSGVHR